MASIARRSLAMALVALFLMTTAVSAGQGGLTVTHFTAFDICEGDRIVQNGSKGFVSDDELCVMEPHAFGLEPGTYSIFEPGVDGWYSDYDFLYTKLTDRQCDQPISTEIGACFNLAVSGTIVVSAGGNGTFLWHVTTFY